MLTFSRHRPAFDRLKGVDELFRLAQSIRFKPRTGGGVLLPGFLCRSHSAYLAAVRLALSGQVVEAYMVLRGCLENALYAFYVHADPEDSGTESGDPRHESRALIWVKRGTSNEATKRCRNVFTAGKTKEALEARDERLAQWAGRLYDTSIDQGAHPNVDGHLVTSSTTDNGVSVRYLMPDTIPWKVCVQQAAEAGLCSLRVFELIYPAEFESICVSTKLSSLDWRQADQ